jgi:hypothetical protein
LNPAAPKGAKPCVVCPATAAAPRISIGLATLNVPTLSSMSSVPWGRVTLTICGPARFTPASFLPTPVKNAGPTGSTCSSGLST